MLVRTFHFHLYKAMSASADLSMISREQVNWDRLVVELTRSNDGVEWIKGVQTVPLSQPVSEIFDSIEAFAKKGIDDESMEFIALDWRNRRVTNISTAQRATSSYFSAHENDLPYEVSPCIFQCRGVGTIQERS